MKLSIFFLFFVATATVYASSDADVVVTSASGLTPGQKSEVANTLVSQAVVDEATKVSENVKEAAGQVVDASPVTKNAEKTGNFVSNSINLLAGGVSLAKDKIHSVALNNTFGDHIAYHPKLYTALTASAATLAASAGYAARRDSQTKAYLKRVKTVPANQRVEKKVTVQETRI